MTDKANMRALMTYAFVGEALQQHDDYVMGFVPLVYELAAKKSGQIYVPMEVVNWLRNNFGLQISVQVAEFMAGRLKKAGLLTTIASKGVSEGFAWVETLPTDVSAPDEIGIEKSVNTLIEKFKEYLETVAGKWEGSPVSDLDDDAMLDAIVTVLHGGNQKLQAALTAIASKKPVDQSGDTLQYLAASFIKNLEEEDDELFNLLAKLSDAAMLAEVVTDLQEPNSQSTDLSHMTAIYDSPLIIAALGLNGRREKESAEYIIARLKDAGANNAIFSHSVDELSESLKALLSSPSHERTNSTAKAIKAREVTEEFVRLVANDPERYIEEYGLQIIPTNIKKVAQVEKHFSDELIDEFYQQLGLGWSKNDNARHRDAMSIGQTMRKRGGKAFNDPMRCNAIFITHNPRLAKYSRRFCVDHGIYEARRVSPAISSRRFSTLLWLTAGNSSRGELSKKELLLNCERLTSIDASIIKNILIRLSLIDKDAAQQFKSLMMAPRSSQVPMDYAIIQQRIVDDEPELRQMISDMKEVLRQEEEAKFEEKLTVQQAEHDQEMSSKDAQLHSAKKESVRSALSCATQKLRREKNKRHMTSVVIAFMVFLGTYLTVGAPLNTSSIIGWLLASVASLFTLVLPPGWLANRRREKVKESVTRELTKMGLLRYISELEIDYENFTAKSSFLEENS